MQNVKRIRSRLKRVNSASAALSLQKHLRAGAGNIGEIDNRLRSSHLLKLESRGCITPAQIENLVTSFDGLEAFEEDPNVLDGYDEVDEASQEKIRTALKEGHVPDEDWRGVSLLWHWASISNSYSGCRIQPSWA